MNCLICGKTARFVFKRGIYQIFECPNCLHRMTTLRAIDIQELYSDNYFFGEKGEYSDYLAEESLLIKRGACYAKIMSRFLKRPGKMLDVGTAAGFVLKGFVDSGWDGTGIEPNEGMANYGRSHLHLKIHTGQIESFAGQEKFDVICLIQVIAHFSDPVKAVRACLDLLKRKGYLLVETWDWRSLTARLLGRFWHEFNPPYVLQWFSWKSLNHLMADLDLKLVAKGCPQKKILSQHAKFLINKKLAEWSWTRAINKIVNLLPDNKVFFYPGGDLFWALYKRKNQ